MADAPHYHRNTSFHELTFFYQRFIPYFSDIMASITKCISNGKFLWTIEADETFHTIKHKLTTTHILVILNFFLSCLNYIVIPPRLELGPFLFNKTNSSHAIVKSSSDLALAVIPIMWNSTRLFKPLDVSSTICSIRSFCFILIMLF